MDVCMCICAYVSAHYKYQRMCTYVYMYIHTILMHSCGRIGRVAFEDVCLAILTCINGAWQQKGAMGKSR